MQFFFLVKNSTFETHVLTSFIHLPSGQCRKREKESPFCFNLKVEIRNSSTLPVKCVPFYPFVMHSSLEPEKMEEGGGSNSLKRKFSEIDGDQNLDSVSSPMMTDSNGYHHLPLFVLDFGSYGFLVFFTKVYFFFGSSYELKVYEVAKNRNIIAVLGTGIDKSEITKRLIKAMGSSDTDKRLIIFLAPTVNLVKQASLLFDCKKKNCFIWILIILS